MGNRRITAVDVGLAVVASAVVVPPSFALTASSPPVTAVGIGVATTVLIALVAFRRVRPVTAFVAGSAAMLLLALLPNLPDGPAPVFLPVSLVYLVLLYSVVAGTPHAVGPLLTAAVGLAVVALRTALDPGVAGDWRALLLALAALAALLTGAWSLGRYHRTRGQYLEAAQERARQAEELRDRAIGEGVAAERRLIAAEMHDVVAHSLAVVVRQSDAALLLLDRDPERARAMIGAARDVGREAMGEMREMLTVLRDGGATEESPATSLDDVVALVERFPAAMCTVTVRGEPRDIGGEVSRAAYRIVQEGLTNAVKHTDKPVTCAVTLTYSPADVRVEIVDDGPGIAPGATGGLGLPGMRERTRRLGGSLEVHGDAAGTRLVATLPTP